LFNESEVHPTITSDCGARHGLPIFSQVRWSHTPAFLCLRSCLSGHRGFGDSHGITTTRSPIRFSQQLDVLHKLASNIQTNTTPPQVWCNYYAMRLSRYSATSYKKTR